jgi:hypothetical protein
MGVIYHGECCLCRRTCTIYSPLSDERCEDCRDEGICHCGYDLRGVGRDRDTS